MGWIAINLVLPVLAPLLLVFLAGSVCTPLGKLRSRLRVIRVIKDGQLGWLAVAFSTHAIYEITRVDSRPDWAGPILTGCIAVLTASSLLAVFGTLFPVPELWPPYITSRSRFLHYRLLNATLLLVLIAGALESFVHFALEAACK